MRFYPRPRALILAAFVVTAAIISLAIANWQPLVANPLFRRAEDLVSTWITASLASATPYAPLAAPSRRPWPSGGVIALEPGELVRLWQSGGHLPAKAFVVLADTPAEFQWSPSPEKLWLLEASTEAAVALGVDAVIDASAADGLRHSVTGRETIRRLREAGILRGVIFDGGHHLPNLICEPNLAILPVLYLCGTAYACHIHMRDAVPLPALARYAACLGLRTTFYTTPRLFTLAKTKHAMAALLVNALRQGGGELTPRPPLLAKRGGGARAGGEFSDCTAIRALAGGGWGKIPIKQNALDLIRLKIVAAFRHQ